jgi:hypothetical protein
VDNEFTRPSFDMSTIVETIQQEKTAIPELLEPTVGTADVVVSPRVELGRSDFFPTEDV